MRVWCVFFRPFPVYLHTYVCTVTWISYFLTWVKIYMYCFAIAYSFWMTLNFFHVTTYKSTLFYLSFAQCYKTCVEETTVIHTLPVSPWFCPGKGWHHQLNGHEFEQAPGVGDGQGGLACCNLWGRKESDMTERLNWTDWKGKCLLFSEKVGLFSSQLVPFASMYFLPFVIARETMWHNLDYEMWGEVGREVSRESLFLEKKQKHHEEVYLCPGHSHILHFLLWSQLQFMELETILRPQGHRHKTAKSPCQAYYFIFLSNKPRWNHSGLQV